MSIKFISDYQKFKNGKNIVLYPIFIECQQHTDDEFWKNIFDEMSTGKCPKCIYISNNTIYSTNKRKNFSYIIPSDLTLAKTVTSELKTLLMNNTSLCSALDIKKKKEKILLKTKNNITNTTTWAEIRKKNVKEIFIINFVIKMKEKYKMDWNKSRHLLSLIQLGFLYKYQSSKDVIFKNKQIQEIYGIEYDTKKKLFYNDYIEHDIYNDENDNHIKDEVENNDNYLFHYWNKYVINMSKIV